MGGELRCYHDTEGRELFDLESSPELPDPDPGAVPARFRKTCCSATPTGPG
ncbi:hypothetical protein N5079_17580 [Planotetraspora sp. A-T 1434]|uniref:hypothetical protein n=1 Tax=Planotetraspora sp. A-T 1434 TaxID=2979219 RepID=UPI0021C04D50|nr:hypothetical protein [Planotetraspora sp. A-T 1434]MCT9932015.1 hypothetical protein [Planotetraspora sp. A-T 1434]